MRASDSVESRTATVSTEVRILPPIFGRLIRSHSLGRIPPNGMRIRYAELGAEIRLSSRFRAGRHLSVVFCDVEIWERRPLQERT
jgi:hypothetical protein